MAFISRAAIMPPDDNSLRIEQDKLNYEKLDRADIHFSGVSIFARVLL